MLMENNRKLLFLGELSQSAHFARKKSRIDRANLASLRHQRAMIQRAIPFSRGLEEDEALRDGNMSITELPEHVLCQE